MLEYGRSESLSGSSEMGLSLNEYTSLPELDKQNLISKTADTFMKNGADFTVKTIEELPELIDTINLLISEGRDLVQANSQCQKSAASLSPMSGDEGCCTFHFWTGFYLDSLYFFSQGED